MVRRRAGNSKRDSRSARSSHERTAACRMPSCASIRIMLFVPFGLQIVITGQLKMSVSCARIQRGRRGVALFLSPTPEIGHII